MVTIAARAVSLTLPLSSRRADTSSGVRQRDLGTNDRIARAADGTITGVHALQAVSFDLDSGDRLALIGRNGSGKTTLLQVLAGILTPDAGSVAVEGVATSLININLGIQAEASGHRNITLRGLAAGHKRSAIESRRQEIMEFSELGDFLDLPVATYSAGMRMRLNFAIATAFDPEILLLDEWISAGDARFRKKASQRMSGFVEKAGILVLASHNRNMLLDNCNKALWLDQGRVQAFGELTEVLESYEEAVGDDG